MANILIYSDPHLGVRRGAHTTPKTSLRLQQQCLNRTLRLLHEHSADLRICLGDLFNDYSNPEEVIDAALPIVQTTEIILAGNHDLVNREAKIGSLQLLHNVYPNKVLMAKWGQAETFYYDSGLTRFVFIPHHSSQELFEEALQESCRQVKKSAWNILCLHCNYQCNYPDRPNEALNLSSEWVERLLPHFHHILLGHEHVPQQYYKGRVTLIGNVHPTGFADISNKRILRYDTEKGTFESIPIVAENEIALRTKASQLPQNPESVTAAFVDIYDDLETGKANRLVTALFAKAPNLCAARLVSPEQSLETRSAEKVTMDNLPQVIEKDLQKKDPELLNLWKEFSHAD